MSDNLLNIIINWQSLVGIFGSLLGIAWFIASRLNSVEKRQEHFEKIMEDVLKRLGSIEGYLRDGQGEK